MLALNGYYDGKQIQTFEQVHAKKNQKLIITVLDEFIEEKPQKTSISARGSLSKYANPNLWTKEKSAWKEMAGKKLGLCRLHFICI